MAINITPLLDALQAKLFSADSDISLTELNALNYLSTYASNTNNVIRYPEISFLNIEGTGDSADSYTGDFGLQELVDKSQDVFLRSLPRKTQKLV